MDNLIIEGFIGSGKGAVGRAVAKKLNLNVIDVDKQVSEKMKLTSAEIYDRFGEPYYRAMETLVLDELAAKTDRSVIVLGSGVATMPQNRPYLEQLGRVYYIKLKPADILTNMRASSKNHAWIRGEEWDEQVLRILKEREPCYREAANVTIDADKKSTDEIASEIVADAEEMTSEIAADAEEMASENAADAEEMASENAADTEEMTSENAADTENQLQSEA